MSTKVIRDEHSFELTINAVIIYDSLAFAVNAKAMLERVADGSGEIMQWSLKPWRADLLKLPAAAETALAEAVEAHLIMLAMFQVQPLLSWLLEWLERWASCRQVQEAALAVWDGGNADTHPPRAAPELSQFAARHGLSLIGNDNAPIEDNSAMSATDMREPEVCLRPTLQHILERPVRDPYQHWGINE